VDDNEAALLLEVLFRFSGHTTTVIVFLLRLSLLLFDTGADAAAGSVAFAWLRTASLGMADIFSMAVSLSTAAGKTTSNNHHRREKERERRIKRLQSILLALAIRDFPVASVISLIFEIVF
jgi:uncharacterized membrane protein